MDFAVAQCQRWRMRPTAPTRETLERHRAVQRLAYRCAEEVATGLTAGVTEREAARRLRVALADSGVVESLHKPFAWFGDRTALRWLSPLHFFPTNRRLEEGMAFILDCAPIVDGFAADIGYATSLGPNRAVDEICDALVLHRALILEGVRAGKTLAAIYRDVDRLAKEQGLENRHRAYPSRVLGHRLSTLAGRRTKRTFGGFGLRTLRSLGLDALRGLRSGWSPLWSDARTSEHPAVPGLWAVEPHLALGPTGAKFEELLVVTEDDAYWLDDDVPHVRRRRTTASAAGAAA